jgi:enamine deaminase RidA (YjgF/YER057c/UK114 family)
MVEIWDAGRHARSGRRHGLAPFGIPVEIEMVLEISGPAKPASHPRKRAGVRPSRARPRARVGEPHGPRPRSGQRRDPLAGITPTPPTDQYVPTVRAGSGLRRRTRSERDGQPFYRGRVGEAVGVGDTAAALRLATQNALASARAAAGSLDRFRCVVLAGFVTTATSQALDPALLEESLVLLETALDSRSRPAVWLRPAQGLAGGMSVEVELLLEARGVPARGRLSRAGRPGRRGRAAGRTPRRSGVRTS